MRVAEEKATGKGRMQEDRMQTLPWEEKIVERRAKERKERASKINGGAIKKTPASGRRSRTPMQRRRPE